MSDTGGVGGSTGPGRVFASATVPAPAAEAGPAPVNGWVDPAAPNGRILPFDLSRIDEDELLRPRGRAALYALGEGPDTLDRQKPALVLVHGIDGDPKVLQAVADQYRGGPYQVFVLAYDDQGRRTGFNGDDFAEELSGLRRACPGAAEELTIVAHSMGGIVSRRALNQMVAGDQRGAIDAYRKVRLVGVDTPWHGYFGPSDRGVEGLLMGLSRPFMPDGAEDMRAASDLFRGERGSANEALRAGLYGVELPSHVEVDVVFAAEGGTVEDFTEGDLRDLPAEIARQFDGGDPVGTGRDRRFRNFWRALASSSAYPAFHRDLVQSKREAGGLLSEACVARLLNEHFPRLPGDHVSVLRSHPGEDLLDYLGGRLRSARP